MYTVLLPKTPLWTDEYKLGTSNFAHRLIMWKSGFGLLTYCTDDHKTVAVCLLGFSKCEILTVSRLQMIKMHQHAKFCEDRSNRS